VSTITGGNRADDANQVASCCTVGRGDMHIIIDDDDDDDDDNVSL